MARIRTIKPEFFTSEDIVSLTPLSRLFYVSLWCEADREGRLEWKPKTFKLRYFPGDDCDMAAMCDEIVKAGLVVLYTVEGREYAEIPTFAKHQVVNNRESASDIPANPGDQADASGTRESGVQEEGKEGREGKGKEGKLHGAHAPTDGEAAGLFEPAEEPGQDIDPGIPHCPVQKLVDAYHELMPANPRVKVLDDARRRTLSARWREAAKLKTRPFGYRTQADGLEAWRQFFAVCNDSEFLTGRTQPGYGRDKPFVADLDFLLSPKGFKGCLENKYHRECA